MFKKIFITTLPFIELNDYNAISLNARKYVSMKN